MKMTNDFSIGLFCFVLIFNDCVAQVTPTLPQNTPACMGNDVDINCVYSFSVGLTVNWIIDGVDLLPYQLMSSSLYDVSTMYNMDTQIGSSTLTILAINITTTLQCQAALDPPVNSEVGRVTVTGPPSPIGTITVVNEVCSVDYTISWDPVTSNPVCGSLSYDVIISPSDGVMMIKITDTSYNVTGLIPTTSYTVTVAGRNDVGVGQSMITNVTTHNKNNVLLGAPSPNGITVVDLCLVDFTISWDPFSNNPVCGSVLYDVTISPTDGVMTTRVNDTSYNFAGLQPAANYIVTVSGSNNAGVGQPIMTSVTTPTIVSALPDFSELANTTTTHNAIVVEWEVTYLPICGDVSLSVMISPNHRVTGGLIVNDNMTTYSNLENGTAYTITVTATNRAGSMRSTIEVTTLGRSPSSSDASSGSDCGATAVIACVVTFILSVTVSVIITFIVTYMIVKRKYDKGSQDTTGKQPITSTDKVLYEPVSSPSHTTNDMELQQNPAYDTSGKVIMDNNPAYESYKH